MTKLATEVRVTGDRDSDMGRILLDAIARTNRRLKDQAKLYKKRKELADVA